MNTVPGRTKGTPRAEVEISSNPVVALLAEQHPDLAHLELRLVGEGWDNAMFRLGAELAMRLPRRAAAAKLIVHEQTWLPGLAHRLTLPVPAPCRVGVPGNGYPWRWSVVPWLEGKSAVQNWPLASEARRWGAFLRSLHVPAPSDAPRNPFRGVPLPERQAAMQERLQRLSAGTGFITPRLIQVWETGLGSPLDTSPTWLHGDLHPDNVLVNQGIISGVIDWGDITSGDPATDLASVWMLFGEERAYEAAIDNYGGISEATLRRAKAWALLFGVMLLETGLEDNPAYAELGRTILQRLDHS